MGLQKTFWVYGSLIIHSDASSSVTNKVSKFKYEWFTDVEERKI